MARRKGKARVTGIGGIFFKARDPEGLARWYRQRLGLRIGGTIGLFTWRGVQRPHQKGHTVWAVFPEDTDYFGSAQNTFMINFRVKDLDAMLSALRRAGAEVDLRLEESEHGRFGWVTDPEGNRIELWEPPKVYKAPEEENPME